MSKHTKGPWGYTYKRDPNYGDGEITDADGNMLAIISGSNYGVYFGGPNRDWKGEFDDADEHEANARLFSAAPDLLIAAECEEAMYLPEREGIVILEKHGWSYEDRFELSASAFVASLRRAAIAKAKGEQP